jgi:hypothetical protein
VQSLVIAGGLSLAFCILALGLWKLDVGDIRADMARIGGDVPLSDALVPMGNGDAVVRGKAAQVPAHRLAEELPREAARLERLVQLDAESHKRKDRFTHLLLVHTSRVDQTREAVEALLEDSSKRWRLISEVPSSNGTMTLAFLARLRQRVDEAHLLAIIQNKGKDVTGVELKPVDALTEAVS